MLEYPFYDDEPITVAMMHGTVRLCIRQYGQITTSEDLSKRCNNAVSEMLKIVIRHSIKGFTLERKSGIWYYLIRFLPRITPVIYPLNVSTELRRDGKC